MRQHEAKIFVGDTLKNLHRDKYLTRPLEIFFDDTNSFLCLADSTCIRKEELARQHFKKQSPDRHKEEILRLRKEYPLGSEPSEAVAGTLLSSETTILQDWVAYVMTQCPDLVVDKKVKRVLDKLTISVEPEVLHERYPHLFEAEAQTPALPPVEDDVLPLVEEKRMTKEELIQETLADPKFLKEISTSVVTGQQVKIPELEALKKATSSEPLKNPLKKRGVKSVQSNLQDQTNSDRPAPLPPVQPPPPPPPPPVPDQTISDLEQFQKMTPWERFLKSNPTLSVQEQLQVAQAMGIRPDESSSLKIVQNSKVKRPLKA